MGLGVSTTARIPRRRGHALPRAELFESMRRAFESCCSDPFLARFLEFHEHEHNLYIPLHPGAEPLIVTWRPDGTVEADTKTSTTGPGYHAYVVETLTAVGQACKLEWDWSGDETGFGESRDFAALQHSMAEFVGYLARGFLKDPRPDDASAILVNMNIGAIVPHKGSFSYTPLGPRDRAWWEAATGGAKSATTARDFFLWWPKDRDGKYYHQLGMYLLWSEVPWRPPTTDTEADQMELAVECFDRAAELDPSLQVPAAELDELRVMLEVEEGSPVPIPETGRIGYFRRTTPREVPGGWTIDVPAYWFHDVEDEGSTYLFWHDRGTLRVSAFAVDPIKGKPVPAKELALLPDPLPDGAEVIEFKGGPRLGRGCCGSFVEFDESGFLLQGCVAVPGRGARVTLWFKSAGDREWAIETFKSLRYAGGS